MDPLKLHETWSVSVAEAIDGATSGKFLIRIINAGRGSSAIYPAAALEAAAAEKIFPAGTHMYIDHAGPQRRGQFGERSIRDLAATLLEDAVWNPDAEALEAPAHVFPQFVPVLTGMKDAIGVSIAAFAEATRPTPPEKLPTVTRFTGVESVDFVVRAGRGGQILAILESAGVTEATARDRRDQLDKAITDTYADPANDIWVGVRDYDETAHLVWFYVAERLFEQGYTVAADDKTITLTGTPTEVTATTTYVPVQQAGATEATQEEAHMATIDDAELEQLRVTANRVATLESDLAAAQADRDKANATIAETARRVTVTAAVVKACEGKPAPMVGRVTAVVLAGPADANLDTAITEAVKAEEDYLKGLMPQGAPLVGFGPSTPITESGKSTRPKTLWDK